MGLLDYRAGTHPTTILHHPPLPLRLFRARGGSGCKSGSSLTEDARNRIRMPSRHALSATVSTLSLVLCLACQGPRESTASAESEPSDGQMLPSETSEGSALPCAAPLAWRVVRVDPDFGLETSDATLALEKAVAEWQRAAGRTLFTVDSGSGSPIRFVFDERQARGLERARLQSEMRATGEELELRRGQLTRRSEAGRTSMLQHEQRSRDLQERVAAHNELVRRWNERGGAPQDVLRRIRAAGSALDLENQGMLEERRRLEEMLGQIDADRARFEEEAAEFNRMAADIDARYPPSRVESGVYREAIRMENGRPPTASREIRVYRFNDSEDLVRVLAHELGHSLGLGHLGISGALMSEEYGPREMQQSRLIHREDVDALVALCPALFEG